MITPVLESVFIPYAYHNGDPAKYDEIVRKIRLILAADDDR